MASGSSEGPRPKAAAMMSQLATATAADPSIMSLVTPEDVISPLSSINTPSRPDVSQTPPSSSISSSTKSTSSSSKLLGTRLMRAPSGLRTRLHSASVRLISAQLSSVGRIHFQVTGDLGFPAVAVLQQFLLVVEQLFAGFGGELEIRPLDDRIHRACLLAKAAIDAFRHVDVIARRTARAVIARLGIDGDRLRGADRLAQFARNAPLLAVGIATQGVLSAEPR